MSSEEKKSEEFSFDDIPVLGGGGKKDDLSFDELFASQSQGGKAGDKQAEDKSLALFERMLNESPATKTGKMQKDIGGFSDEDLKKASTEQPRPSKSALSKIFVQTGGGGKKAILAIGAVSALLVLVIIGASVYLFLLKKSPSPPPQQAQQNPPTQQAAPGQVSPAATATAAGQPPAPPPVAEDSDEIKGKYDTAKNLFNDKKYAESLSIYNEIIPKTVKKSEALFLAGQCHARMGDSENALRLVDESIGTGKADMQPYALKIGLLNAAGKLEEASAVIDEASKKFPDVSAAMPNISENLYLRQKPAEALEMFRKCQKTDLTEQQLKIFARLSEKSPGGDAASLYIYAGKKFQDVQSFIDAIRLIPQVEEKIEVMTDAVSSMKSGTAKSQCNLILAEILVRAQKPNDAVKIVEEIDSSALPADTAVSYVKLLDALSMGERMKTEIPALLEKNYSNLDFSRSVQDILRGEGSAEYRKELFKNLYDKKKDAASEYLYGRALGDSPTAKDYFQGALKKNPLFDSAWYGLGKSFMQERNWKLASDAFSKCVEIDKFNRDARFQLALCSLYQGSGEKAVLDYENYLKERNAMDSAGMMQLLSLAQRLKEPALSEKYLGTILADSSMKKLQLLAELRNKFIYGTLTDADFAVGTPGQARTIYVLYLLSKGKEKEVLSLTTPPNEFPDFWKVFLCWKENVAGWRENAEILVQKAGKSGKKAEEMVAMLWLDKISPENLREFSGRIPYEDEPLFYWMIAEKYLKLGNKTNAKVCFGAALKDSQNILNKVVKFYSSRAQ